ncbi:MAG: spore coat associated protein CotJA, partial [Clostridia bacterium]|nr:spore coat associated protein CotJA [Clostridia bacterium]
MKFDGNNRYSHRADYEQFSDFLGLNSKPMQRMEQRPSYSGNNEGNCACKNNTHLAMVYPVKQEFCDIYDVEIALINGTIFAQ